jgi:iron complex transport system substrate-binding protein
MPERIVCLTEETTEWLYLLGEQRRIVGISGYTVRPAGVRQRHPRVSAFLDGKIEQIVALEPDLVIGFSDMQAALADKLIRAGLNVLITNQRSLAEIYSTLRLVAGLVGASARAEHLIAQWQAEHAAMQARAASFKRRPRVYFEEWDEPMISAIRWVSELMAIAGGDDVFPELARQSMGRNRIVAEGAAVLQRQPDIIIGSWCGKHFRPERVAQRPGWAALPAVRDAQLFEVKSCLILQPGPAALSDGVAQMQQRFVQWEQRYA